MESKNILHKWALYTGIALWIVGFGANIIFAPSVTNIEGQMFLLGSVHSKWFWSFLLFVVAIPFIVEVTFRYWGTGEKHVMWISFGFMALSVVVICVKASDLTTVLVAILSVAILVVLLYLLLQKKREPVDNFIFLIVGSTFIWIASYMSRVGELPPSALFGITKLAGLSLICCYLVINHGVLTAVLAHACNNAIVALPLIIVGCQRDYVEVEKDGTHITLQRIYTGTRIDSCSNEQVLAQGSIDQIVHILARENNSSRTLFVPSDNDGLLYYRLCAKSKHKVYSSVVFSAIEDIGLIEMDTTYEPLWLMEPPTSFPSIVPLGKKEEMTTIGDFANWIRQQYRVPIALDPTLNPKLPFPHIAEDVLVSHCRTFCEFAHYLNKKYGVVIRELPHEKACVVRIRYSQGE